MTVEQQDLANVIRALAMDAVQKANSGHPGMPMGMADVATILFTRFLKYDASNPYWADRDRFILSAGHGSMLLYALLYLTGYSDIDINEGKKILAFFDAGCEHCMEAAKSITQLSEEIEYFPQMHIIFSDSEEEKIPAFFEFTGKNYSYQVLPFYNEDDEINSYLEILGYEYENPAIIYLDNGNQMRFYDGTANNAFAAQEFEQLFQ